MALKKKSEVAANKAETTVNYDIKVTRAKDLENGTVMFDMIVNGVQINGCSYRTLSRKDGSGDFVKIGFPSRKGSDDKYYNQVYFKVDDDIIEQIENGINELL